MPILFCNVAWMNDYAGRSADARLSVAGHFE
ncbi:hypothetical protein X735_31380 [Mesorhizobium sp. L2C085B000]|nr:hypothetical protein X766_26095 [Mesorhizobium sp. LSJC255A00]ESZ06323.1 hypothetical protein X735_31380 [Mesorhizobium sp. L2C085B000]